MSSNHRSGSNTTGNRNNRIRLIHTLYLHTPQIDCRNQTHTANVEQQQLSQQSSASSSSPHPYYFPITYTNDENIAYNWIHEYIPEIIPSLTVNGNGTSSITSAFPSSTSPTPSPSLIPIGFDCEWQPTFDKGQEAVISVLQFATKYAALVFQVNAFIPSASSTVSLRTSTISSSSSGKGTSSTSTAPTAYQTHSNASSSSASSPADGCLIRLLNSSLVLFIGMGINSDFRKVKDDVSRLLRYTNDNEGNTSSTFLTTALCELKSFGRDRGIDVKGGLLALTQYVDKSIAKWKSNALQMSKWQLYPLKEAEVRYAAMDAWSAVLCYENLIQLPIIPPVVPTLEEGKIDSTSSSSKGNPRTNSSTMNTVPKQNNSTNIKDLLIKTATTSSVSMNPSSNSAYPVVSTVSSESNVPSSSTSPSPPKKSSKKTTSSPPNKPNNYYTEDNPSPAQIALNMLRQAAVPPPATATTERRNSKLSFPTTTVE